MNKIYDNRYQICHLFPSPLSGESRLFKELATAEKLFPAETLLSIGLDKNEGPLTGKLQGRYPFERIRLKSAGLPKTLPFQLIKYLEWTFRAAWRVRKSRARVLHCHSLPALLAGVLGASLGKSKILYDAHELESQRSNFSKLKSKIVFYFEKLLLIFVDEILTVSPSICNFYKNKFPNKNISLIMNIPMRNKNLGYNIRSEYSLKDSDIIIIYVGGFLRGRGIDLLLDSFSHLDERFHLIFMGRGVLEKDIMARVATNPRIHLRSPVDEYEVVPTISHADLSFSVNDCSSLNHQYALPNKFFQSLMAGVPVIVNKKNIDMLSIGKETGIVFGVDYNIDAVRDFICNFPKKEIRRKKFDFSWEGQESALIASYNRLLEFYRRKEEK